MVSFQTIRAGAQALRETELGAMAASSLGEAATTASKLLSEVYPSCKGMLSRASDLFKASSVSLEGQGALEMSAAERAATPGGKSFDDLLRAYREEQSKGFSGTRALIEQQRTGEGGFNLVSRQVERLQGIGVPSAAELPRSLEGIRSSMQPVAADLQIGSSSRAVKLHSFAPLEEANFATKIQPSSLRYPPATAIESGSAARAESAVATAKESGGSFAETVETATGKAAGRVRKTRAGKGNSGASEVASTESAAAAEGTAGEVASDSSGTVAREVKPRVRRSRKAAEPAGAGEEAAQGETLAARAEPVTKPEAPAVKGEAPKPETVAKVEPPKPETVAKVEPPKPETVAKVEPPKPETVAKVEPPSEIVEDTIIADAGEAGESVVPKLSKQARRELNRARKADRRIGRSVSEEELEAARRA